MATDGPDPPPCDPKIFREGEIVFTTNSIPSNAMEGWVRNIAELSEQPVDWHFVGGRVHVLALGDLERVRQAIHMLLPEHNLLFRVEMQKYPGLEDLPPPGRFV